MTATRMECPEHDVDQPEPCLSSLACWWRQVHRLETALGYARSSLPAREVWDQLLAAEILTPREALYLELRECVEAWQRIAKEEGRLGPTLLDRFIWLATAEGLSLPEYAPLAAFRLRQRLNRICFHSW